MAGRTLGEVHRDVSEAKAEYDAARERRAVVLQNAHARGATWKEIGQVLGVSAQRAEIMSLGYWGAHERRAAERERDTMRRRA